MNEASSKFVDRIATEKLVNEKLKHSRHSTDPEGKRYDTRLDKLDQACTQNGAMSSRSFERYLELRFDSLVNTGHNENDLAVTYVYKAEAEIGRLVFMHGLYEDNLDIYSFFIRQLNEKGISVYLMILPFHYSRKPAQSAFSGEFFWSGDVNRSALGFKQAVYDLFRLYCYLKEDKSNPVGISGFSMGGGVALTLASLTRLDRVFAINPVCNFASLVWTSPLFETIKADLLAQNFDKEFIAKHYYAYDPLNASDIETAIDRITVGRSIYDQINDPENYDLLLNKWGIENVIAYKAGHLNILRVPKLALDISSAF